MTRYFIPKDTEPDTAVAGVRRMTVYAYSGDSALIPDYYDEVQIAPANAIVIRREELPEVRRDGDVLHCGSVGWPVSRAHKYRDAFWRDALQYIALVEYLREHPPVDEARVKALADRIRDFAATNAAYPIAHADQATADARAEALARHLIETEVTP